jgi:hypothetical protein
VIGAGIGFDAGVGVGVGVAVAVGTTVGDTVDCRPSVPEVVDREAFLKGVGVVPVFVAIDPPQPQSRTISVKKTRRRTFLFFFIIIYLLPKAHVKNKKPAIYQTFWLFLKGDI